MQLCAEKRGYDRSMWVWLCEAACIMNLNKKSGRFLMLDDIDPYFPTFLMRNFLSAGFLSVTNLSIIMACINTEPNLERGNLSGSCSNCEDLVGNFGGRKHWLSICIVSCKISVSPIRPTRCVVRTAGNQQCPCHSLSAHCLLVGDGTEY